ncbi:MAG: protein translocase subunit SecD [Gaiellales bacterium]
MSEKRKNLLILLVVLGLAAASVVAVATKGFTQGLDLQGGLEVVLKAQPRPGEQVTASVLQEAANVMGRRIDPQGVKQPEIRTSTQDNTIEIALPGVKDPNAVANLLTAGQLLNFDFFKYLNKISQSPQNQYVVNPHKSAYDLLTAAGKEKGADKNTASEWGLFDSHTHNFYRGTQLLPTQKQVLAQAHLREQPPGTTWRFVPHKQFAVSCSIAIQKACYGVNSPRGTWWYMFNQPPPDQVVTGNEVSSAQSTTDSQTGEPIVAINYKGAGAQNFLNLTQSTVATAQAAGMSAGAPNAIVVDNQLVSTPVVDPVAYPNGIDVRFSGSGSQITGLSKSEADRIALEIQSGTLPVTFTTESENIVSATLGKDALHSGLIAGAAGIVFVLIFLLIVYGFLGLIADIALIIYGLLLAGIVAIIPVTMTLPGIAGTILTIGVAADANIVIFERIKEEVRAGKSIKTAIATGYRRGFHTIIDANVVTLITAAVLYASATSSVKGFALMLLIGVITSIFTAVVATRAMLGMLSGFAFMGSNRVLGQVGTGDRWKKYDFIGRRNVWFAISGVVIVIAAISLGVKGLNQGIDFTGGTQLDFKTKQALSTGQMQSLVQNYTGSGAVIRGVTGAHQSQGSTFNHFQVQSHFLGERTKSLVNQLEQHAGASDFSITSVSSSFGQSVLHNAYLAILFSLIIIFIYISFRFEWTFAIPVMLALAHDIVITIGVYSISGRAVTADTVAAVLTVLGYSMYDTVIVFDRVRENIPILRRFTASKIVNESLAETITRSLATSFVTLVPVVLLFIFGTGALTDFAFALIVGIISGAYSSIFIAAPLLAMFLERQPAFEKRRKDADRELTAATPQVAVAAPTGLHPAPAAQVDAPAAPATTRRRRRRAHGRNR